jgi:hypothetical protein
MAKIAARQYRSNVSVMGVAGRGHQDSMDGQHNALSHDCAQPEKVS